MKRASALVAMILCGLGALTAIPAQAYNYCGFHDRRHELRAYFFNSEFWVDMLVAEAQKWNAVHPVLTINRSRSRSIPLGRDGQSIVAWISEADLERVYNLSWASTLGWTTIWMDANCGRFLETDTFFNPGITLFTPQAQVPYSLGYHEIALHELGHVLTLGHEDGSLSVMTGPDTVSDVLHHNDKVGWIRSAAQRFNPLPTPREDVGIFPLRSRMGGKTFATLAPGVVPRGTDVTIRDLSVENLSSVFPMSNAVFRVLMESASTGTSTDLGSFSWASFPAFSGWSGSLVFTVPSSIKPGTYLVVGVFDGSDSDGSNDRAVFGKILVP